MFSITKRHKINDDQWNQCVLHSRAFKHYYLTYYLDNACDDWEAVVHDNYRWVWPLPIKRLIAKKAFQPLLTQQLGPIGDVSHVEFDQVVHFVKQSYALGSVKFNDVWNKLPLETLVHRNLELALDKEFSSLEAQFNRNIHSNLRKAEKEGVEVKKSRRFDPWVVEAFRDGTGRGINVLTEKFYAQVEHIFKAFEKRGQGSTYTASLEGRIIAQVLVLDCNNRLLFFFSAASDEGRRVGAMHALVSTIIHDYADTGYVLDFEGSDQDGLAYFYASFGAIERVYLQGSWSRVPWPLSKLVR